MRALSDADQLLGGLAGEGRRLPNPHLLIRPFVQREAVFSSRIEGYNTAAALLRRLVQLRILKQVRLAISIFLACRYRQLRSGCYRCS